MTISYDAPFYGRDPEAVARELDSRLKFVFDTVRGAWCVGCGHHVATHIEGGCLGQTDHADEYGTYTVSCRCSGYEELIA